MTSTAWSWVALRRSQPFTCIVIIISISYQSSASSVMNHQSSVINHQQQLSIISIISYQSPIISYQSSIINHQHHQHQLSIISIVSYESSIISYHRHRYHCTSPLPHRWLYSNSILNFTCFVFHSLDFPQYDLISVVLAVSVATRKIGWLVGWLVGWLIEWMNEWMNEWMKHINPFDQTSSQKQSRKVWYLKNTVSILQQTTSAGWTVWLDVFDVDTRQIPHSIRWTLPINVTACHSSHTLLARPTPRSQRKHINFLALQRWPWTQSQ